jgi:hypothetical protein
MMSDAWDIIHGPNRDNARTDENSSLQGRLDSFKDLAKNSIPIKRTSDGTIIGTTINGSTKASVSNILQEELSIANDKDDAWIRTDVNSDNGTNSISIHHTFTKAEDTFSDSNVNDNKEDTINLYTPIVDAAGHVVGKNIEIVTLPYGYKTFSGNSGTTSANSTQAAMTVTGDDWITTTVSDNSIGFSHIGPVAVTATKLDDITPKFGETFEITDWYYDEKGHKSSNNTHTVKIPKGSLTDAQSNQADVITQLSFVDSTGALSTTRTNISNLLLTDYSKKTNNEDVSNTDALGDALSKLQT